VRAKLPQQGVIGFDRHGDPILEPLPKNATQRDLDALAEAERASPLFRRMLASAPTRRAG